MKGIADLSSALDVVHFAQHRLGYTLDPWQIELLRAASEPRARVAVCCSRQSGKSFCASILALHEALYTPGSTVVVIANAERQAAENLREIVRLHGLLRERKPKRIAETTMELHSGSRVLSLPGGNAGGIRGYTVSLAIMDECAFIENDREVYSAVAPMLAVSGGRMLMASTPNGSSGVFYDAVNSPAFHVQRVPATDIPRISAQFLDGERQTLPREQFEREYMCCFSGTDESVFTAADIEASFICDAKPLELPPCS